MPTTMRRWEPTTWAVVGLLTTITALAGLLDPHLYDRLIPLGVRPGAVGQDAISLLAGLALVGLALVRRELTVRGRLLALGLLGYLVYAYGIYVIERMYNLLYLVYLAIFALALWALVLGTQAVIRQSPVEPEIPASVRRTSAVVALLQPVIFYPLWIAALLPLLRRRDQIDSLYSIFILDLCLVMPAFLIVAVGLLRSRPWAATAAPIALVLGAVLMLSLSVSEGLKPLFGVPFSVTGFGPPTLLCVVFGLAAVLHLRALSPTAGSSKSAEVHSEPAIDPLARV